MMLKPLISAAIRAAIVVSVISATSTSAWAQWLHLTQVASGLNQPLFATHAPGDPNRLFILEKTGAVKILNLQTGTINPQPFLTISNISTISERGLLGMAFAPDYQTSGNFYVNYTDSTGTTRVQRYQRQTADLANAGSAFNVMSIAQPQANHNGGWMSFGPDNMLYIATGDGGGSNDPGNNGQNLNSLLGKMLRIDVTGDDFPGDPNRNYRIPSNNPFVGQPNTAGEVWAYGLRNPWRNSFDRLTGDLYIADVGQNAREELNLQLANSPGGENYGWRLREGTIATPGAVGGPRPPGAIDPFYEYNHGTGPFEGRSVTGGYVYRGPIAGLQGHYFFADYISNRLWSLQWDGTDPTNFDGTNFVNLIEWTDILTTDGGLVRRIASFGEDYEGNLYLINLENGTIFRIAGGAIPEPGTAMVGVLALLGLAIQRRRRK